MKKILIANRGEIAVRIIRTCREMGIATVAVASEADRHALHVEMADEHRIIGPAAVTESYLLGERIIETAKIHGADALHPGFGFLSENAAFAAAVEAAGLIFIGPNARVIELMGSKQGAKQLMIEAGVPVVPGYNGKSQDPAALQIEADRIGYPLLIKASAGGGGKGMRVVRSADAFLNELATAKREAGSAFGDETMLLERYLERPRHIEFQIFGDRQGNIVHLFERECSIQRRHQKIIEETPSVALGEKLRAQMAATAIKAARCVDYTNAGTVEFMLDEDGSFYFLEMNTRLQVEHPITEMLTGLDLVRWQIEVARGQPLPLSQDQIRARGHAMELRIYAEDPAQNFFPQIGKIVRYHEPRGLGIRVDSGIRQGDEVGVFYDPMLAKLVAWGASREQTREKLVNALDEYCIHGVKTNISFLKAVLDQPHFIRGETTTDFLERHFPKNSPSVDLVFQALALTALATPEQRSASGLAKGASMDDPWTQLGPWRACS